MTKDEIVAYWIASSEQDYGTMHNLYASKDYHWSLFMGQLVIEKLLKAIYVEKVNNEVPRIHDLLRLTEKAGLSPSDEQADLMDLITSFNIAARYPDYKQSFYKKCTPEFTSASINAIKELREWLLTILEKR